MADFLNPFTEGVNYEDFLKAIPKGVTVKEYIKNKLTQEQEEFLLNEIETYLKTKSKNK